MENTLAKEAHKPSLNPDKKFTIHHIAKTEKH